MPKCDNYLKHINIQYFRNVKRSQGNKMCNDLSAYI